MYGFEGWMIKINGNIFPNSLIRMETYKITPDQETDLDDYTDNNGRFHRNVLPAKATKIEFETKIIRMRDAKQIFQIIPENDDEVTVEYWNPRKFIYQSGDSYVPDIQYTIRRVIESENDIEFGQIRIAFIEYGEMR